eukprot:1854081-Amphidinium_carterae.1
MREGPANLGNAGCKEGCDICLPLKDVLPTLAMLANIPLPADRVYDGRDMGNILFDKEPSRL